MCDKGSWSIMRSSIYWRHFLANWRWRYIFRKEIIPNFWWQKCSYWSSQKSLSSMLLHWNGDSWPPRAFLGKTMNEFPGETWISLEGYAVKKGWSCVYEYVRLFPTMLEMVVIDTWRALKIVNYSSLSVKEFDLVDWRS